MNKEDVINIIKDIEHPEIAVNPVEPGMVADLNVKCSMIRVTLSLPDSDAHAQVLWVIEQSISRMGRI